MDYSGHQSLGTERRQAKCQGIEAILWTHVLGLHNLGSNWW